MMTEIDTILCGDALEVLRSLPDGIAHCCVTSPPYFNLRSYLAEGDPRKPFEIGLEATIEEYVARIVEVFREVRRVLKPDGTLWLNLGDSYADDGKWGGSTSGKHAKGLHGEASAVGRAKRKTGLKPKDLMGIPWRCAFALQADGWWLRSDIVWHKPNPMPESVQDRPTRAHEYIFLLTPSARYFYDADAIREPLAAKTWTTFGTRHRPQGNDALGKVKSDNWGRSLEVRKPRLAADGRAAGANKRDVWTVASEPYPDAHFATFPTKLIEPCILAGTSPRVCEHCGTPWRRLVEKDTTFASGSGRAGRSAAEVNESGKWAGKQYGVNLKLGPVVSTYTAGWRPGCGCARNTGSARSIVLDPFFGRGTVGRVARRHSRHYIGIELNPEYVSMAEAFIAEERQPVLWTA